MNQASPTPEQTQEQSKTDKEMNFEKLRRSMESERLARQQAEARMADLERQVKESQRPYNTDDDSDEPYVDHKNLNKRLATFEKSLEEKIDKKAEEKARTLLEKERQANYLKENNDFHQILNSDVVQKFADSHPRLAERILEMPDNFERQKLVYETIKSLGIDKPQKKEPSIQERIEANRRSPFAPQPGHSGPGYSAQGDFSDSGIKSSYDKMQELKKRLRI